jgi:hypothetical protein
MNAQPKAKADQQRRANRPDPHPSDVTPQEPTAPDSLLKVYQEQELKDRELRDNAPSQTDLALSKPDDAGLFSGLLQHWISPQDHALLGMDSESPLTDASGLAPPAALSITPPPEGTLSPRSPNPFLDASRLDLRAPDVGTVVALPSEGPAPGPQEWTAPAPPAVQTPPVPARDATPTPQAHPADDKKYFPQLDRF